MTQSLVAPPARSLGRLLATLIGLLVLAVLVGVLLNWSLQPITVLEVRAGEEGRLVSHVPIDAGERFEYSYTHSVHRTLIRDTLEVAPDGRLMLVEAEFDTTGAGVLPEMLDGVFTLDGRDGKFRVSGISMGVSPLEMRVAVAQQQSLTVRGETISINSLAPPQTRLLIAVASRARLASLLPWWE